MGGSLTTYMQRLISFWQLFKWYPLRYPKMYFTSGNSFITFRLARCEWILEIKIYFGICFYVEYSDTYSHKRIRANIIFCFSTHTSNWVWTNLSIYYLISVSREFTGGSQLFCCYGYFRFHDFKWAWPLSIRNDVSHQRIEKMNVFKYMLNIHFIRNVKNGEKQIEQKYKKNVLRKIRKVTLLFSMNFVYL